MNYSIADLQREISREIESSKRGKAPKLHPDWITQSVMNRHKDIRGADADFHTCCSRATVRKEVAQQLNRTEAPAAAPTQFFLEGFQHLQHYYLLKDGDDRVAVRLDLLTDGQIEQKADEYVRMGNACMEHADELRRYKKDRAAAERRRAS